MTETPVAPPVDLPDRFVSVDFEPVPWHSSLLAKLFITITLTSLGSAALGVLLTVVVHRVILAALIPQEIFSEVSQAIVVALMVVIVVTLGASALVAWLLSRYLTNPIRLLMEAMGRVFKSDLSTHLVLRRHDELGSLAAFFNSMVQALRQTQERNQAISKLKSQFVSVAAHQLRTPLTGLKWSLQWLMDEKGGSLTAKQRQAVEQQFKATGDMIHLVNELLDVAVVEEGKFRYNLQKVVISGLAQEVVQSFVPVAEKREVKLELKAHIREGLAVVGDPVQLKLTLSNLVDNALRYSKAGGVVTIELLQGEDWVTVHVRDTGIGIPPVERERVFQRFFRASNAQRLQPDGSGLGLYIVRNVIRGHGGKITLTSKEGEGTTVTFTLPLRQELVPQESLSEGMASL